MSVKVTRSGASSKSAALSKSPGKQVGEVSKVSFLEILEVKDDERTQRHLEELLRHVEEKGRRLAEQRTVEALFEYKKMVKGFIEEAVEFGLSIDEKRGFSRGGRSRILKTVSAVDQKLLELTDIIVAQEAKNLNILKRVGEIKGMLVNLYL
jgi:uncharacterized protein